MYDIIIIGSGIAGMTSAIYSVRSGKTALMLEASAYGGQIINATNIENYPGLFHISGFDFATTLFNQAKELGAEIKFEKVISIESNDSIKIVKTNQNEYKCRSIILATGAKHKTLGLENEQKLIGHGVSYCATCDGMFFKNKSVAVNGGGNTAIEDAIFLSNYCSKVYLIHRREQFRAHEKEIEQLRSKKNVELILNSTIISLNCNEKTLKSIDIIDVITKKKKNIEVSGLFIAIGQSPDNSSFKNIVELDETGYICASEDCITKTKGIFVAGDCRTKTVRQLTTAASDGSIAALAACEYIDSIK